MNALTQYSFFSVHGEDAASILTSYITVIALVVSAAFLSGVQLVGNPIKCWCPAETSDSMCICTKSICWISQQYVIDYVSRSGAPKVASGSSISMSLFM